MLLNWLLPHQILLGLNELWLKVLGILNKLHWHHRDHCHWDIIASWKHIYWNTSDWVNHFCLLWFGGYKLRLMRYIVISKFFDILLFLKQLSNHFLSGGRVVFFNFLFFTPLNLYKSRLLLFFSRNLGLNLWQICCNPFLLFDLPRSSLN
jgi:hypothetical protein